MDFSQYSSLQKLFKYFQKILLFYSLRNKTHCVNQTSASNFASNEADMELQLKDFVFLIDRDGVWQHRKLHLHENAVGSKCIV
jgi:hypothetical protein